MGNEALKVLVVGDEDRAIWTRLLGYFGSRIKLSRAAYLDDAVDFLMDDQCILDLIISSREVMGHTKAASQLYNMIERDNSVSGNIKLIVCSRSDPELKNATFVSTDLDSSFLDRLTAEVQKLFS